MGKKAQIRRGWKATRSHNTAALLQAQHDVEVTAAASLARNPAVAAQALMLYETGVQGGRRAVGEILDEGRTPAKAIEIAANAASFADYAIAQWRKGPDATPIQCREGCAWCCYTVVEASVPEVLGVVAYLSM